MCVSYGLVELFSEHNNIHMQARDQLFNFFAGQVLLVNVCINLLILLHLISKQKMVLLGVAGVVVT